MKIFTILLTTLLILAASNTFAQDKTGTNPIDFTYDYRIYTEMQQFKNDAGSQIRNIMEFRLPLGRDMANVIGQEEGGLRDLGSKFQLRVRGYFNHLSINDTSAALGANSISGFGDLDARFLWIPKVTKRLGLAVGLEAFFNTASSEYLGAGRTNLAPIVFVPIFNILGKGSIFAPGYQYVFNVNGETTNRSQIDLYFVWGLAKGKNWLIVNPQIVLDHQNSAEFMVVDAEWGFMIAPQSGISGYVRPGLGVGADRPFDYNLEFAIKFVWK
jgi:hypothetical protein